MTHTDGVNPSVTSALAEAVELLEIWQSHLGASRAQCDVGGRITWDRIERVRAAARGVSVPVREVAAPDSSGCAV